MEKLLSSRSLKKEPKQRWEPPAWLGLLSTVVAMALHVGSPPASVDESIAALAVAALCGAAGGIMYCWVRLTTRLGVCPSIYHSTVLKPVVKDKSIRFQVVPGVYLSFPTGLLTLISVVVTWEFCRIEYTKLVAPVLLVLATPLLCALCAFIICKEGIQFFQILGVVCECVGLGIIAASVGGNMEWTFLAFGGAGLTALTARSILLKITQEVRFDHISATILELLIAGFVCAFISLYSYMTDPALFSHVAIASASFRVLEGFCWVLSAYLMNLALYRGPAALVVGIYCLSVGICVTWSHPDWNNQQLCGVSLTVVGVFSFLFLDSLLEHTALGRTLSKSKKQPQRESFTSAAYIRLIDR